MRNKWIVLLLLTLAGIVYAGGEKVSAQGSEGCDSVNEAITQKFRFLGKWNQDGKIEYGVIPGDTISDEMTNFVEVTLPETINIFERGGDLFDDNAQLNTVLKDSSDVWVTFIHEGARYKNVLGYYTYPKDQPPASYYDIDSLTVIFPNVEAGTLDNEAVINPGEKVHLGWFPANTVIGYFVIADGWVGDTICYLRNYMVFTDKQLNTFTAEEYRQQTIQMYYTDERRLILGFEDLPRPGGDQDFNDVMFYVTAEPGAIDTANIPHVPTALMTGDTVLCDPNAPAQVRVDLTGKGPWTIVYYDGRDSVKVENIESSPYLFTTTIKDTIRLVSVKDQNMHGTVRGSAVIEVSNVDASFLENPVLCEGDETGQIGVALEGHAPWTFTYSDGGQQYVVEGVVDTVYYIDAELNKTYRLIGISDKYCVASLSDTARLEQKPRPVAELTGYDLIGDEGVFAELYVELTGTGPWYVAYDHNGVVDTAYSETAHMVIPVNEGGIYFLTAVMDAYCPGTISGESKTLSIDDSFRSKAVLTGHSNLCGDESAWLTVAIKGKSPWTLTWSVDGNEQTVVTEEDTLRLEAAEPGLYKLVSVFDADHFYGTVEGEAEILQREIPTAEISGHSAICGENPAEIRVDLTGVAPWTVIYTDGSQEYGIESTQPNVIEEVTQTGNYQLVSVQDAYCPGTVSGSADINYYEVPTATLSGGGYICNEGETVDLTVSFTGDGPWKFVYTDGTTQVEETADHTPYTLVVSTAGNYELVSVENAFCSGTVSGTAYVGMGSEAMDLEIIAGDNSCEGETIPLSIEGETTGIQFELTTTGAGTLNRIDDTHYEYIPGDGESGLITFDLEMSNACGTKTVSTDVNIIALPDASFTISPDELYTDNAITFVANGGAGQYNWDFGDGNAGNSPTTEHVYTDAGQYKVVLTVETSGCSSSSSKDIEVFKQNLLFVPTAFNLNAINPENRVVKVYGTNISEEGFSFKIVNRWGKVMYKTGSFKEANTNGWKGLNANNGEEQALNVFTWILKGKFNNGETFEKTGTVTLVQ